MIPFVAEHIAEFDDSTVRVSGGEKFKARLIKAFGFFFGAFTSCNEQNGGQRQRDQGTFKHDASLLLNQSKKKTELC